MNSQRRLVKKATSGSRGPFSGMLQGGSVITSVQICSHSRITDRGLLCLDNSSWFYCKLALVHIGYQTMQFTYSNFASGAGRGVLICRRH